MSTILTPSEGMLLTVINSTLSLLLAMFNYNYGMLCIATMFPVRCHNNIYAHKFDDSGFSLSAAVRI